MTFSFFFLPSYTALKSHHHVPVHTPKIERERERERKKKKKRRKWRRRRESDENQDENTAPQLTIGHHLTMNMMMYNSRRPRDTEREGERDTIPLDKQTDGKKREKRINEIISADCQRRSELLFFFFFFFLVFVVFPFWVYIILHYTTTISRERRITTPASFHASSRDEPSNAS